MAAEGEKVEKEKVLPKDAQVIASFVEKKTKHYLYYVRLSTPFGAGDGGYFEGHGHQRL